MSNYANYLPEDLLLFWQDKGIDTRILDSLLCQIAQKCYTLLDKPPVPQVSYFIAIEAGALLYQQLLFAGLDTQVITQMNKRLSDSFKSHQDRNEY